MRKKLIFKILGIVLIVSFIYVASPKWGSFYNLILRQYKNGEFTEASITIAPTEESNYKTIKCTDKNNLDEIVKYLKKLRIIELKNSRHYTLENPHMINFYFKKNDGSNIFNYKVTIRTYKNNLKIINVSDQYGSKYYKIIHDQFRTDKFNFQYIKNLIENKQ
ncbi:hypothetical protein [Haloimpatiens lingqiaonensis]|uniref:hypothetical protein n=1 Tax=Haloimpatiens lingqiaonensis TaxID=1380675 RepID=UPI0010FCFD5D|nr:hypothetical protein [Haloimpatiens lingqiaonensis]